MGEGGGRVIVWKTMRIFIIPSFAATAVHSIFWCKISPCTTTDANQIPLIWYVSIRGIDSKSRQACANCTFIKDEKIIKAARWKMKVRGMMYGNFVGLPSQLPFAERTTNRSGRAIRGSERSAGTRAPDHERGGAMYDCRSRQPITPRHLITPRSIDAGWSRDSLAGMPITRYRLLIAPRERRKIRLDRHAQWTSH